MCPFFRKPFEGVHYDSAWQKMCMKISTLQESLKMKSTILYRNIVENIKSETLFDSIKDGVSWIDIVIAECKV